MAEDPRSLDQIERDLADTRHHLETTLDALQHRMSPGSMFEDALDYVRRDSSAFGRNFVETVRDNPLPATLMTIGLGWMMMAGRNGAASHRYGALVPAGERESLDPSLSERAGETTSAARERLRSMGQSIREQQEATLHGTAQAAHAVSDRARQSWETARGSAESAMYRGREVLSSVGHGTRTAGRSMAEFFDENPMAVGIMAAAAGAALAAFLPRTRTEDETLGPLRDRALEQGREQGSRIAEDVSERARAALNAAAHPEGRTEGQKDAEGRSSLGGTSPETRTPGSTAASSSASPTSPLSAPQSPTSSTTSGTTPSGTQAGSSSTPARPTGSPPNVTGGKPSQPSSRS
jgi:ElaB/YqjD/DUF883 family membrane-anchored ribosome-binding protein